MSDIQQGPDWWLATDGKWYPQSSKPDFRAAPQLPEPPIPPTPPWQPQGPPIWPSNPFSQAGPVGISRVFSGWLQGVFWGVAALFGLLFLLTIVAWANLETATDGTIGAYNTWVDAQNIFVTFRIIGLLAWTPVFVLLVIWSYMTHKAASALLPSGRTWASGWAVGSWFIPLAAYVIPRLVFVETERVATAPRSNGQVDPNWRQTGRVNALGWGWWLFYIIMGILMLAAVMVQPSQIIFDPVSMEANVGALRSSYVLNLLGTMTGCASCILGALYFRYLTKHLTFSRA